MTMKKNILTLLLCSFLLFFIVACNSLSVAEKRGEALSLLDENSAFYLYFSAEKNQDLAKKLIKARIPGISDKDAASIASRVSDFYAGIGSEVDFVGQGSFPAIGISRALSEKNGWKKKLFAKVPYYTNSASPLQLSFPKEDLLCASSNVTKILERSLTSTNSLNEKNGWQQWLSSSTSDIAFYVMEPSLWISAFTGKNTGAGCRFIWGELSKSGDKDYSMTLYADVINQRALPAVKAIFTLAFADQGITLNTNGTIVECSIQSISEDFILRLF